MGEVGSQGEEFHTEVGEYAAERGIETLYALGDLMRYSAAAFPGARHFASMQALQAACLRDAAQYRSILIKGSRFMRMEQVLQTLQGAMPEAALQTAGQVQAAVQGGTYAA
jgi:UDP-N-acetylmuramyl pentapeptide synthase